MYMDTRPIEVHAYMDTRSREVHVYMDTRLIVVYVYMYVYSSNRGSCVHGYSS